MKLAEALSIRKDLQKRIEQLKSRLLNNVKVQEGDEPAEKPAELMAELDRCLVQLQELIYKINVTNLNTKYEGRTLTEMMAERDVLKIRIQMLRDVFQNASQMQDRYSRTEIKMVTTVDVKALGQQLDHLSAELRKLDVAIQTVNFTTELNEEP